MEYTVRTRYGWGWEVVGPSWQSHPIESAIAAQTLADRLNEGHLFADAVVDAKLTYNNGRLVCAS